METPSDTKKYFANNESSKITKSIKNQKINKIDRVNKGQKYFNTNNEPLKHSNILDNQTSLNESRSDNSKKPLTLNTMDAKLVLFNKTILFLYNTDYDKFMRLNELNLNFEDAYNMYKDNYSINLASIT